MNRCLALATSLIMIGGIIDMTTCAQARPLTFMNSQGYQTQLAASRKAYADAIAAQTTPQATYQPVRRKKSHASRQ